MERIIHIARIRHGDEADVRRALEEDFPAQAVAGAGIRELNVFVGSGYVVTEYDFPGEYGSTFKKLWEDASLGHAGGGREPPQRIRKYEALH